MIVAIHNIAHNDNKAARFAEMTKQVEQMQKTVEELSKPGVIETIVSNAIRPIAAEIALQEKETKQRSGMLLNSQRKASKYLLPKGD